MYRLSLLVLFSYFSISSVSEAITLSVKVTPSGAEDAKEAMDCEMTLSRGRQNPVASLDNIKSDLVAAVTRIDGYRIKDGETVHVKTSKFSEIPLDFDHFVKGVEELAGTSLKGHRDGGPIGPRVTYRGTIGNKKFLLRDTSEIGEVYNPHEDEPMLRDIVLKSCYGRL